MERLENPLIFTCDSIESAIFWAVLGVLARRRRYVPKGSLSIDTGGIPLTSRKTDSGSMRDLTLNRWRPEKLESWASLTNRPKTLCIFLLFPLDLKNKTSMRWVKLPFQGQVSKLPRKISYALDDFLRSDHVSFWNNPISLSAIFLSDTAELRGYMTSCYHEDCDGPSRVTPQMLQFLQKTSDVILAVTNDVTKMSCPSNSVIHSKNWSTTYTTSGKRWFCVAKNFFFS